MTHDRRFIREHTRLRPVSFLPEIRLWQASDDSMDLWETTAESPGIDGIAPPFWAFAWAGGVALARHLLDYPQLVAGRVVVDVATGSGVVAIAAALAGAAIVGAYDVDPLAVTAARMNAEANGVRLDARVADVDQLAVDPATVVLAGDICYDAEVSDTVLGALHRFHGGGADVLIGDPYRHYLPVGELHTLATYEVAVDPDLESTAVKAAVVARLGSLH